MRKSTTTTRKEHAINLKQSKPADKCSAAGLLGGIVGDSPVRLWGLSSRERLRRQLGRVGVTGWMEDEAASFGAESVLLVRADHLYDERILAELAKTECVVLRRDDAPVPVAAHVPRELASQARRSLEGRGNAGDLRGVPVTTPRALTAGYIRDLRKFEPAAVVPIDPEHRSDLERDLFDSSYKGVTDLVTKWAWPVPARWATRTCARLGIRPNHVTSLSVALVLLAAWLFAQGRLAPGLLLAWLMTFLDTVDGKLARVTVDSSHFGHYLDHGLDIAHPPLWYFAWGVGLSPFAPPISDLPWPGVFAVILVGYVAGRLVEGAFTLWLGSFSIFCWRPVDSYFRLVVARRNPNLLLLSGALLAGRPDSGLVAVAVWTTLSMAFLIARLLLATHRHRTSGPLHSWLEEPRFGAGEVPLVARPFVRRAEITSGSGRIARLAPVPAERLADSGTRSAPALRPILVPPVALGRPVRTGVISNPASARNDRRRRMARMREAVSGYRDVPHYEVTNPRDIAAAVGELLDRESEVIVVNGGDGTVQAALTALFHRPSLERLPLLAVLPGGTTNMTAGDVGLAGRTEERLRRLLAAAAAGRLPGRVVERPVLGVDFTPHDRTLYGLFFGAGAIYHLIRFFHRRIESLGMRNQAGPGLALALFLAKVLLGSKGSLLPPLEVRGRVDGESVPGGAHVGLFVTTLERLFFGLHPFWGDEPGTLRYSALGYSPLHLLRALLPVLRGRPTAWVRPEFGYMSRKGHEAELFLDSGFALDGELFTPDPASPVRLRADRRAFFLVSDRS